MGKAKLLIFFFFSLYYFGVVNTSKGQDMAALSMMARNNLYEHWDFNKASYYFDKVIGKKYTPAFAYSDYGWYLILKGDNKLGMTYIQKASEMDPKDIQLATWNAWAKLWNDDIPKAKKWIDKSLKIGPKDGETLYVASLISSRMNNHAEAIKLAEKASSFDPNYRVGVPLALVKAGQEKEALILVNKISSNVNAFDAMLLIEVYANLGNDEKTLDYFEKSFELRHPFMPWLESIPKTNHLHSHPRHKAIVKKMKLPK